MLSNEEIKKYYTTEEIESIYRYQEMQYLIEDANYKIEEYVDWKELTEEEEAVLRKYAPNMAQDFLDIQDMNVADNGTWDDILNAYIKQLKARELK